MWIAHVGQSTLFTPHHNLSLKNVLHVHSSQRNLVSIHRFTHDNHVFVEYHHYVFLFKDPFTRKVFLHGRCKGGLYPFPSLE
jgi:Zn-dependent M28 family amino/carboxypeptidase